MAAILISALITDGASVLFEVVGPTTTGPVPLLALPRYELGPDDDSIEDALAAHLHADFGFEVQAQEFVDTVYERSPGSTEVLINNVQLVNGWSGTVPGCTAGGAELMWVPVDALAALELPDELRVVVLNAFGIEAETRHEVAEQIGRVIVITGPAGAGKSTVSVVIARTLPRCALVRIDDLSHAVVSGAPVAHWNGGDFEASYRFWLLAQRNAATLARNFSEAGYDVVVEGIFEQPRELDLLLGLLGAADVYFITLMPGEDELVRRDQGRSLDQRMGARSLEHHNIFSFNGEFRGLRLDTTGLSAQDTAILILDSLPEARVK